MKKFWIACFIICTSFAASAQSIKLQFDIKDYPDSIAYLGYFLGSQKYVMDTVRVGGSQFNVELSDPKEGLYFVYSPKYYLEFVMDGNSFSIKTTAEGAYQDMKIKGSRENEIFRDFQINLGQLQVEQRTALELLKSGNPADSANARKTLETLDVQMKDYRLGLIAANQGTFVAEFLSLMNRVEVPEMEEIADPVKRNKRRYFYYKEHFMDDVQLADPRLLRTPLLHPKVMEYFEKVIVQNPDSINLEIDKFFQQVGEDDELFRYWLVMLFKNYTESKVMGMDAVMIHLIESYYLSDRVTWITEDYRKQLKEELAYVKYNLLGLKAPPLNVVDTLMQPFDLEEVDAPYTLLFIYDPDCGHCKKAIKKLEEFESEIEAMRMEVVAVCTTTDVKRWHEFVATSNPMWHHVIDPTGESYFRVYYNVRTTPQIYLLDEEKRIIAKRLDIDQIVDLATKRSEKRAAVK